MTKLVLILLVALVFEAIGVIYLSRGLRQVGAVSKVNLPQIVGVVQRGAANPNILMGIFFEAIFFAGLLVLMSKSDVSFIWPLTSLGFVITTLAARLFLHEQVSAIRWAGVLLIMAGAALITWTEHAKPKPVTTVAAAQAKK
jgi:drug/metabolite transporter (DMT)-like permease